MAERLELDQAQQLVDATADLRLLRPLAARLDAQPEGDVLEHRHVAEQRIVLEDEADLPLAGADVVDALAAEAQRAGIGKIEPGEDAQQRRLARARGAEQRDELAILDRQADAAQRFEAAELLDDGVQLDGQDPASCSVIQRTQLAAETPFQQALQHQGDERQ